MNVISCFRRDEDEVFYLLGPYAKYVVSLTTFMDGLPCFTLEGGTDGLSQQSVKNYHHTAPKNPEDKHINTGDETSRRVGRCLHTRFLHSLHDKTTYVPISFLDI